MNLTEKLNKADDLFKFGSHEMAAELLSELLLEQPTNHSLMYKRGHCYYRLKDYKSALIEFNNAIDLYKKLSWYYGSRGSLFLAMNEAEKAIADYSSAISLDKSKGTYHHGLGRAYYKDKNYTAALESYRIAETLGVDISLWEAKANCLMFMKNLEDAIEVCNEQIEIDPTDYKAYLKKGVCLHYIGWKRMEQFIKSNKHYSLAEMILVGQDFLTESIAFLSMAIHLNNKSEAAYKYRGLSYNLLQDYRQALVDFESYIQTNPNDDFVNTIFRKIRSRVLNHSGLKPNDRVKYLTGSTVYTVKQIEFVSGKVILENDLNVEFECEDENKLQLVEENSEYLYYSIPDLPNESWSPVTGIPNILVSDHGRVKNIKGFNEKLIKIHKNSNGDCFVNIKLNKDEKNSYKSVAQLVAESFIPNPMNFKYVKHLNSNSTDNSVSNLSWTNEGAFPKTPTTEYFEEKKRREDPVSKSKKSRTSYEIDDPEFYYYSKGGSTNSLDWLDEETNGDWRWNID